MNKLQKYPDLETCKAISHLFPDSEMVWAKWHDDRSVRVRGVTPREDFICNAPDCVELGEWLHGKFYNVSRTPLSRQWELSKRMDGLNCYLGERDLPEVQARTKAIKQIIESE